MGRKYSKLVLTRPQRIIFEIQGPTRMHIMDWGRWKMEAERIESFYSKKLGVMMDSVSVLVHVRPLKASTHWSVRQGL